MDSFRDIIREQADDVAFPVTEHVTPVGWKTKVMDGVRIAVGVRHPSKFGRLPDICAHTDASPWLNLYICDFSRALVRGTRRFRSNHTLQKGVEESVVTLFTAIPIAVDFDEQYAFAFEVFDRDMFEQPVKLLKPRGRLGETKFVPSADLTATWLAGVEQYIVDSKGNEDVLTSADASDIYSNQLIVANKIQRMFATIARLHSSGDADFATISDGIQFSWNMQHEIADRFHIEPAKQSAFIYQFHQELREYILDGGKITGSWGCIEDGGGTIVLNAVQAAPRLPERKLAPIIE